MNRKCKFRRRGDGGWTNGHFHEFTSDGSAIVEMEDGMIEIISLRYSEVTSVVYELKLGLYAESVLQGDALIEYLDGKREDA